MSDFLGISKRKWLAFVLFTIINTLLLVFIISPDQTNKVRPFDVPYFTFIFLIYSLVYLILSIITNLLSENLKESMKHNFPMRYFVVIAAILIFILQFPINDWYAGILCLVLYFASEFLAGLVFPFVPVKSKSDETKSS